MLVVCSHWYPSAGVSVVMETILKFTLNHVIMIEPVISAHDGSLSITETNKRKTQMHEN